MFAFNSDEIVEVLWCGGPAIATLSAGTLAPSAGGKLGVYWLLVSDCLLIASTTSPDKQRINYSNISDLA